MRDVRGLDSERAKLQNEYQAGYTFKVAVERSCIIRCTNRSKIDAKKMVKSQPKSARDPSPSPYAFL